MTMPSTTEARAALEALRAAWEALDGPERGAALLHIDAALDHLAPAEQGWLRRQSRIALEAEQASRAAEEARRVAHPSGLEDRG